MKKFLVSIVIMLFLPALENTLLAQDVSNKLNMLEIVISNLIARVESLEKRVNALEKNPAAGVSKAPKKGETGKEDADKSFLGNGFEDIGRGFCVKSVRFSPFGVNVLFTGEIANRSEKNYRFAKFQLEIYDSNNMLIKKEEFTVPDIPKNSTKTFEAMLTGIDAGDISRYTVKAIE